MTVVHGSLKGPKKKTKRGQLLAFSDDIRYVIVSSFSLLARVFS